MPLIFRVLKMAQDGKPMVGQSATSLGVRIPKDIDMTRDPFLGNPDYVKYVQLTFALHVLMAHGKADTEEAETLREEVLPTWGKLNAEEMERVNGLSADLYMLEEKEVYQQAEPKDRSRTRLAPRLKAAWDQRDWDKVLALLRTGPDFLSRDQVAYLRGRCWHELGHHEVALSFFEYAAKHNPQNVGYRLQVIRELVELGKREDALQRADSFQADEDAQMRLLLVE